MFGWGPDHGWEELVDEGEELEEELEKQWALEEAAEAREEEWRMETQPWQDEDY